MAPITLRRLVKELDKLKPEPDAARLKSHDYARRLARMIRQLRKRGLDADRAAATAALAQALKRGAITAPVEANLQRTAARDIRRAGLSEGVIMKL
ncbi:MAG TPA: hypothetical protein VIW28_07405 [Gemmatimonadales bacterium]|jgi:hypothetical protein